MHTQHERSFGSMFRFLHLLKLQHIRQTLRPPGSASPPSPPWSASSFPPISPGPESHNPDRLPMTWVSANGSISQSLDSPVPIPVSCRASGGLRLRPGRWGSARKLAGLGPEAYGFQSSILVRRICCNSYREYLLVWASATNHNLCRIWNAPTLAAHKSADPTA